MVIRLRDDRSRHRVIPPVPSLGDDLRALRQARGLRLADLAGLTGRSVGWLSQVERGLSVPSVEDLRLLARHLDVPLSSLFRSATPEAERGHVLRRAARRPIKSRVAGLVEQLLSPDLDDCFEVVHATALPGGRLSEPVVRDTHELGYVLSGRLDLWIGVQHYELEPGDSFRIRREPFIWMNPHAEPCELLWVIAPPVP